MKRLQIYYGSVEILDRTTGQTEIVDKCIYKENATPKDKEIIATALFKKGVSHRGFKQYEIKRFLFETAKKVGKTVYYV